MDIALAPMYPTLLMPDFKRIWPPVASRTEKTAMTPVLIDISAILNAAMVFGAFPRPPLQLGAMTDSTVNVEKIMREVRATVGEKRDTGAYPPEVAAEIDSQEDALFDIERLERAARQLRQAIAFSPVVSTESGKPYLGPAISGVKRGVMRMTQWYIAGILDQVRVFSEMSLRATRLLVEHSTRLEERVQVLEEEVRRLGETRI